MKNFNINPLVLKEFEENLDTLNPQRSPIPAKVIGFGEISSVFVIDHPELKGYAFKRLPIFSNQKEAEEYEKILKEYINILENEVGIKVVQTDGLIVETSDGRTIYYVIQELLPPESIGNKFIKNADRNEAIDFFKEVIRILTKVEEFNEKSEKIKVGIDGQISNWVVFKREHGINPAYLDVSTPLYRKEGKEMLKADLFLKSAPPLVKQILKFLFLEKVLNRYYDLRLITIDLIANLLKEKLDENEFIPELIEIANRELPIDKITFEEVKSYYKEDAFIWSLFLSSRKFYRFIKTKIFRSRYDFILPEKIER